MWYRRSFLPFISIASQINKFLLLEAKCWSSVLIWRFFNGNHLNLFFFFLVAFLITLMFTLTFIFIILEIIYYFFGLWPNMLEIRIFWWVSLLVALFELDLCSRLFSFPEIISNLMCVFFNMLFECGKVLESIIFDLLVFLFIKDAWNFLAVPTNTEEPLYWGVWNTISFLLVDNVVTRSVLL